nr:MAG TPA: hypothetical protein [Caudoviricetes sp.]
MTEDHQIFLFLINKKIITALHAPYYSESRR